MKRISIRELQKITSSKLEQGPFEITKHGKTIAKTTPLIKDGEPEASLLELAARMQTTQNAVVSMLKGQRFFHSSIDLEICPIHGVYKKTCGCK